MKTITATWRNGQVLPDEAANWPEGCRLRIEPIQSDDTIGMREEDWSTSPEAIAAWLQWLDSLEPLEFTSEEEANMAASGEKVKQHTIANMV